MSFPIIHGIMHYLLEFPFCTFPSYYRPRATLRDCWRPLEHKAIYLYAPLLSDIPGCNAAAYLLSHRGVLVVIDSSFASLHISPLLHTSVFSPFPVN